MNITSLQGDLVLIPAGCAHQVENCSPLPTIKVAQDLIAAESVARCWEMMVEVSGLLKLVRNNRIVISFVEETRMFVQMRAVKAMDKLQLRLALRFAAAQCDELLGVSLDPVSVDV